MPVVLPFLLLHPLFQGSQLPVAEWQRLATAHDAVGLVRYLARPYKRNPFLSIATPGAYVPGEKKWRVYPLTLPGEQRPSYVVFSSIVIVEDLGDLIFSVGDDGKLTFIDERETLGATIGRHSFDVRFDLKAGVAKISDRLRLTQSGAGPVLMRIGDKYHVKRVLDAKGRSLPFARGGGTFAVRTGPAKNLQLEVDYEGNPDNQFMAHPVSEREATLAASLWYPMIGRRPTPYDLTVHMPRNWIAVGQGEEVGSKVQGNEQVTEFRMDLPAVWLSLSAGPFKRVVTKIGGREYATVSASMSREAMELQNRLSAEPIEFYSRNFARYPFSRWTNLDSWVFGPFGGALEAYSYATYPTGAFPALDGHETGHTWWGGILNNDYMKSFWNESFAEYSNWLFLRERPGANRAESRRAFGFPTASEFTFKGTTLADGGDIAGPYAPMMGYQKGPMVLSILEDEIGTEKMIRSMREWIASNPPRHIGAWEEFEATVNRVTGKDYRWFFDEWARREGIPNFSLTDARWSSGNLKASVAFTGQPYRFRTDALLRFADGQTKYRRVEVNPDSSGLAKITVPTQRRPVSLTLDPWQVIPRSGSAADAPFTLGHFLEKAKVVRLKGSTAMIPVLAKADIADVLPDNLDGKLIVGDVSSLKPLLEKAGFSVSAEQVSYEGTPVNLLHGGLLALVNLPSGKRCAVGLGRCRVSPISGKARLIVFDQMGKLLRAKTEPISAGALTRNVQTAQ